MELKQFFPEIDPEKRLALGCMRLPLKKGGLESAIDYDLCNKMVDRFMEAGFNYFDTARVYHARASERMIKRCIADRYPRESFVLTNKLSDGCFKTEEDIRPLFEDQLRVCGVDYFDFYLMHSLHRENYDKYQETHAFEIAQELKAEGKIRHVGFSFHDDAEFLEQILNDHPEAEVVQIQFNYLDFDSPSVQSGKLYEICEKYGKPVLVMEPVRGGALAELPPAAQTVLDELWKKECASDIDQRPDDEDLPAGSGIEDGGQDYDYEQPSPASYALRFAASFPNIAMVLSGMGDMEMIEDNVRTMSDFCPIDEDELEALEMVKAILQNQNVIQCTACHYCTEGCPQHIRIPDLFADYNRNQLFKTWNNTFYYEINTTEGGKASDCIKCGKCEKACPQHLPIRELLEKVAAEFEK